MSCLTRDGASSSHNGGGGLRDGGAPAGSSEFAHGSAGVPHPEDPQGEGMEGVGELDTVDVRMLCQMMRKVDVTEVYSPERVAKVAKIWGL